MRPFARYLALILVTCGLFAGFPAVAADYYSVAATAVMYDAPSLKAKPLFAIAGHTPVEGVVALEGWIKVRDAAGDLAWIEKQFVMADKRTLQVTAARAQVRARPEPNAALVFEAEKDVILELVEAAPPGWAKIKHRDGQSGYIRAGQVWGL